MQPDPIAALFGRLSHVSETLSEANLSAAVACLRTGDSTPAKLSGWSASLSQKVQREAVQRLAEAWAKRTPKLTGSEFASALVILHEGARREAPPEIAWSGPTSKTFSYRTTQELIREMIDASEHRLLIVSYTVSPDRVLQTAGERGIIRVR